MGDIKVPMLANRYAREHLRTPLPFGDLSHRHNLLEDTRALCEAVSKVPAVEKRRWKGRKESCGSAELTPAGPSKLAVLRRVICLLTRSRVWGRMKVAFRSFCHSSMSARTLYLRMEEYLTLRFATRMAL